MCMCVGGLFKFELACKCKAIEKPIADTISIWKYNKIEMHLTGLVESHVCNNADAYIPANLVLISYENRF